LCKIAISWTHNSEKENQKRNFLFQIISKSQMPVAHIYTPREAGIKIQGQAQQKVCKIQSQLIKAGLVPVIPAMAGSIK
jgi:hypothetical protein